VPPTLAGLEIVGRSERESGLAKTWAHVPLLAPSGVDGGLMPGMETEDATRRTLYGFRRLQAVDAALRRGEYAPQDERVAVVLTAVGVVLGAATIAVVLFAGS
jgi:hypothetical protein